MPSNFFVNEIFYSVQGEGIKTGIPAVFIRLQGCLCQCPWCDTKWTWKLGRETDLKLDACFTKADSAHFASATASEIVREIKTRFPQTPLAVITGGEPCLQPIDELCRALLEAGLAVQIETSGTEPVVVPDEVFVTMSPKVGMPGGREMHRASLSRADEIKMVLGSEEDLKVLDSLLTDCRPDVIISLQPLSCGRESTELCIATALKRGAPYRVSLQSHKYLQVR